jgi:16S rRNA (adenine1518-N6/adenine1519-N6)-dimethyltransferase
VARIERRAVDPGAPEAVRLAAAAFGQRRKMLRRSLAAVLPAAEAVLTAAGVDPTRRAEDLSPADYLRIAAHAR